MKIEYNTKIKSVVLETKLVSCLPKEAQFFTYKEDGFISYELEVKENLNIATSILNVVETSKKYVLNCNTTDVIGTNIYINNIPYYYKISYIGDTINLQDLILNTNIPIIEVDGVFYTNEVFANIEIKENVFIFSEPVIDSKDFTVRYKKDFIELTYTKQNKDVIYFKTKYKVVIQPIYVNNSKIAFSSFYCKQGKKLHKCIEGDITYTDKTEFCTNIGNRLTPKDLVHSIKTDTGLYNFMYNSIYTDSFYYTNTDRSLIEYTAKKSNFIFDIDDIVYFLLTDRGLERGTKSNYSFYVKKKVDMTKFNLTQSNNLNKFQNELTPFDYQISNKKLTDNEKVGLKENIVANFNKSANEVCYVFYNGSPSYQYRPESQYTKNFYEYIEDYKELPVDLDYTKNNKGFYFENEDIVIHKKGTVNWLNITSKPYSLEVSESLTTSYNINDPSSLKYIPRYGNSLDSTTTSFDTKNPIKRDVLKTTNIGKEEININFDVNTVLKKNVLKTTSTDAQSLNTTLTISNPIRRYSLIKNDTGHEKTQTNFEVYNPTFKRI